MDFILAIVFVFIIKNIVLIINYKNKLIKFLKNVLNTSINKYSYVLKNKTSEKLISTSKNINF